VFCAHFCSSYLTKLSSCGQNQVKEKTIAARRSEVRTIIFPSANRRDFDELAANVKEGLDVHFVDDYDQIFDLAFGNDQNTGK
jgi:Lon-like ATP-dependent protease